MICMNRFKSYLGVLLLMLLIEFEPSLLFKIESFRNDISILTASLFLKDLPFFPINIFDGFSLRIRKFHFKSNIIISIKEKTTIIISKTCSFLI